MIALLERHWLPLALATLAALAMLTAGVERSRRLQAQTDLATYKADHEAAARKEKDRLTAERDALAARLSTIDAEATAELRKAQNENANLRNRLAVGSVGLRVKAVCPASGEPPRPAEGGSLDTGTTAVLDPSVGQDYSALRENIISTESKLSACQSSLKQFSSHE